MPTNALAPPVRNAMLRPYTPSWREQIEAYLMGDARPSPERRQFAQGLTSLLGFVPGVGNVLQGQEAARAGDSKGVAMAMLPIPGAAKAGAVAKAAEREAPHIIAYHGSPHSFDRFDMSKIGTGEGAQAYGHGLYFADSEGVAKSYRDQLSYANKSLDGKRFYGSESHAHSLLSDAMDAGGDIDDALRTAREQLADFSAGPNKSFSRANIARDAVASLEDWKARNAASFDKGSMYQVRINADPEHFLDWDKPLSEHPEAIRRKLGWTPEAEAQYHAAQSADDNALLAALEGDGSGYTPSRVPVPAGLPALNKTGADIVRGGSVFDRASDIEKASKLREAGIPGIKYLDQGSRAAGEGSRNYVVFDDKLIEIMKKYGLVGPIGAGIALKILQRRQPPET